MELVITEVLDNNIWGQCEAKYTSSEPLHIDVKTNEHPGASSRVWLNTGDICTVDFMSLKTRLKVGDTITVEPGKYLLSNYAKNPAKGVVVIIYNFIKK